MKINNKEQANDLIGRLSDASTPAQINILRKELESLELASMYYEQKDSAKGMSRTEDCIAIIKKRLEELV